MLVTVPLFHLSGLYAAAVTMLAVGGKAVFRSGRFDPADVLRLIEQERVTSWSALGSMAHQVVSHPDVDRYDLSSIRNIGSGGAPVSADLQARMREAFPNARKQMGIGYGLTESSALATINFGEELAEAPESVGRPLPTVSIQIRDEQGRALPEGREGEIHVRSPLVMKEYWRRPEETRATIGPGRWLRTGDIGRIEGGRLFIASRKRDLILRGGENVYPAEIEQCLESHPDVCEAAVVGREHAELGQEVEAVVVPVEGAEIDTAKLRDWVAERLAYYKVPVHWQLRAQPLPRNASGKIMKHLLDDEFENPFIED
jgi:acyl-CoA synthetase (AMP-forming)/AMP-acid ligase II